MSDNEVENTTENTTEKPVDHEKDFNKMKKTLKNKFTQMNLSERITKLQKKIEKFDERINHLDATNALYYRRLRGRAEGMLEQAYLHRFLSLHLTDDACRLLLCVVGLECDENSKLSSKNVLLNYLARNRDDAKLLFDAYNDIFVYSRDAKQDDMCDEACDDVCVTFSENLNFPSIGYIG